MAEALSPAVKRTVPWLVAVAFFMEALDTTILNTAVPTIAAALRVAPLSMKSVLSCYTLSLAVFIPISGWAADRFGTRRVFAAAIGVFSVGMGVALGTTVGAMVAWHLTKRQRAQTPAPPTPPLPRAADAWPELRARSAFGATEPGTRRLMFPVLALTF